jgi:hypothetical protein
LALKLDDHPPAKHVLVDPRQRAQALALGDQDAHITIEQEHRRVRKIRGQGAMQRFRPTKLVRDVSARGRVEDGGLERCDLADVTAMRVHRFLPLGSTTREGLGGDKTSRRLSIGNSAAGLSYFGRFLDARSRAQLNAHRPPDDAP